MKLVELFKNTRIETPNLAPFLRDPARTGMPPLDTTRLALESLVEEQRLQLRTAVTGTATLLIRYKDKEGAVLSLDEREDGDVWEIPQVQGARSQKSYRLTSGLRWQQLFGTRVEQYATHPDASVRHITMKPTFMMTNITDAASEHVRETYEAVRSVLGMRWSKKLGVFIRDVRA